MRRCTCCQQELPSEAFGSENPRPKSQCLRCRADISSVNHARRRAAELRVCVLCGEAKPLDEFVARTHECSACRTRVKRCRLCRSYWPLSQFSTTGRGHDGRATECRPCAAERFRLRRGENDRARARDPRRKARRNARLRERRRTDEAYRAKARATSRVRSQSKKTGGLTRDQLGDRAGWVCYLCDRPMDPAEPLDIDHRHPLSLGGTCDPDNVALTHRSCNRSKGARLLPEVASVSA